MFAALRLFVDNWRWQDVPFYLRTGKRMAERVSEAVIQFRAVPHRAYPASADRTMEPNRLVIRILPDESIVLRFQAKYPGQAVRLEPVSMRFAYEDSFDAVARDPYETLLRDVMDADATLFMRGDQVEAAWEAVMPVLDAWAAAPDDFPDYPAGSWGPVASELLLARDGRQWLRPAPAPKKA